MSDLRRVVDCRNSAELLRTIAMGCAGAALVCAALAVERDPWLATLAALAAFGVAGELAAQRAHGPGSFAAAMIDALHGLDRGTLRSRLKVS